MNYRIIGTFLGNVLRIEALLLLLPCLTGFLYHETQTAFVYLLTAVLTFFLGLLLSLRKDRSSIYYAREGFVSVGLAWILMSILGALPFVITREIPNFVDALFETVSGFTTTGASILPAPEAMTYAANLWRCLTHWIGGMGIIVFMLAIFPSNSGYNMHLMKAESPGPQVGKLVPKIRETAQTLYRIYLAMTIAEIVFLFIAGMPLYDSVCTAFGSAGTGGYGIKNDSMASYSVLLQIIITVFILGFGVNFNFYYYLLRAKSRKEAFKMEEVKVYFLIVAAAVLMIAFNVRSYFGSFLSSLQQSAFQVASIITTTGYATTNFDLWPTFSKGILVMLMFIGACAGSTGGGVKVSRVILTARMIKLEILRFIHPNQVRNLQLDGKPVDDETLRSVGAFMLTFVFVFIISVFFVSLDNVDLVTAFTSVAATLNNIGPGLSMVGPSCNYGGLSVFSKAVLMFDMLAGRLELFPILLLLAPQTYSRKYRKI